MKQGRFSLSQETITILTVGVALAGLILVSLEEMRAESRADRAEARAAREAMRAEARADREAFTKRITPAGRAAGNVERSGRRSPARHSSPPGE